MSLDLVAGLELNLAVAEAIGATYRKEWKSDDGCWNMAAWYYGEEPAFVDLPRFSTDLNAAFIAADKLGLFNSYRVLRMNRFHWEVMEIGHDVDRIISQGDTPALAICAAILNLKDT